MDFFISSDAYHNRTHNYAIKFDSHIGIGMQEQDMFTEQLVRLSALGNYFNRPKLFTKSMLADMSKHRDVDIETELYSSIASSLKIGNI
jgi:hypothetical protein